MPFFSSPTTTQNNSSLPPAVINDLDTVIQDGKKDPNLAMNASLYLYKKLNPMVYSAVKKSLELIAQGVIMGSTAFLKNSGKSIGGKSRRHKRVKRINKKGTRKH